MQRILLVLNTVRAAEAVRAAVQVREQVVVKTQAEAAEADALGLGRITEALEVGVHLVQAVYTEVAAADAKVLMVNIMV